MSDMELTVHQQIAEPEIKHEVRQPEPRQRTLREQVSHVMQRYFSNLDGTDSRNIYDLVLEEVEAPLFEAVMRYTQNNQSETSRMLGLARGTVRKKLKKYGLIDPSELDDETDVV